MNILIAEDNELIQMLQKELMENWGYSYDLASNGIEAVEYAKKNKGKYDLCLMDVDMPKMNGIEATEIIRKIVNYFPIVGHSANETYEKACYEAGMDDFVAKPCLPEELSAKINQLTVKLFKFITKPCGFGIEEVMPVDQQHAQEIKKLKEQGLVKVSFGTNVQNLTLHEYATNKISHDFIVKEQSISVFLNHDQDKPTRCELYREHCHVTQTYLDDADYDNESAQERAEMQQYKIRTLKPERE